jgi:malate dehydrogenase (oxaloacetate-decarboxylating)
LQGSKVAVSNINTRKVALRGLDLIREPLLNKGSAFTAKERIDFGLEGLLPYRSATVGQQAHRVLQSLERFDDPLEKYMALAAVHDRNEHLYFYLLRQELEQLLPIVYTPTVGLATMRFSHVFQRGRGVWITPDLEGSVARILRDATSGRDIRLIVITDNESILGIGDQGAGGMAISIGKLAIYTAGAGIDPAKVLPISFDVGTENQGLLDDPMYLGWPARRLRGAAYDALLDEFVAAVNTEFPGALVQWEDFRKENALRVMDRYRNKILSFNDDIQGTGAVALAGLMSARRVHGRPLSEERVVIVGAGAAGLGIFRQIRGAMQADGLTADGLKRAIAVLDSKGLIIDDENLSDDYKREFAWSVDLAAEFDLAGRERDLQRVCERFRPTVLIGTSGQQGLFSEAVVRALATVTERPVILPMSNPTEKCEAVPRDLYAWTDGLALVAAGSPFPDVVTGRRTRRVGQGNNAFIFPGIGLGALQSGAREITDSMFNAAAIALAGAVTDEELASGLLYPPISRLEKVSLEIARAVIKDAVESGQVASLDDAQIDACLEVGTWSPTYSDYEPASV